MRSPRIYCNQPLQTDHPVILAETTAHYVAHVLRMKVGAPLQLFNGTGGLWQGCVHAVERRQVVVQLHTWRATERESLLPVHLGQAVSRFDRMDYAVQKATELGVTCITPLLTQRCEVRLDEKRGEKKRAHWQQIAISACEQCGRNTLPEIAPCQPVSTWLGQRSEALRWVLHQGSDQQRPSRHPPTSVALLVGPEGGLTAEELQQAQCNHFTTLTLGPRILRTETAPIVALSVLHTLWGDFFS